MNNIVETNPPVSVPRTGASSAAAIALLIAIPILVFGPSALRNHFVNWDDEGQLYQNPDFNPPTVRSVIKYWYAPHMNLYMPITYSLWGGVAALATVKADSAGIALNPLWFHGLNLLLHIGATLAVFAILRQLIVEVWPAFVGAIVFAVHPIQCEAVCWASGMYTILSGLLIFGAIFEFIQFAKARGREGHGHYLIATILFVAAMFSKPSAVVAVPMVAIIDLLVLRRNWRSIVSALGPWLILTLPIILIIRRTQPAAIVPDQPVWTRLVVCFDSIGFYLTKLVCPLHFAVDYGRTPTWLRSHPEEVWVASSAVTLLVVSWAARRKTPWLPAGLGLFVAGTLPFLGLVKFDFQHFSTVADRYAYPGMLGVALMAAGAISAWTHPLTKTLAVLVLSGLAWGSHDQADVWRDTRTLFNHNLHVNPRSLQAHGNLGFLAMNEGRSDEAIAHFRQALATDSTDPDANTNLANALMSRGDLDEAIGHYRRALQITPNDPRIENNLGIALARSHQYGQAAREFQAALDDDGMNPEADKDVRAPAHVNLGLILQEFGRFDEAAAQYRAALAIDPQFKLAQAALNRLPVTQR
jgi:Flp pilus assembly protein TadD